jgi:hypothetical protein
MNEKKPETKNISSASFSAHPPLRRKVTLSGLEKCPVSAVCVLGKHDVINERTLSSIGFCAEIIVVSEDETHNFHELFQQHAQVKNIQCNKTSLLERWHAGLAAAQNAWILLFTAHDVLDYEAATTIQVLDLSSTQRAWKIPVRPYVCGREIRYGGWLSDPPLRLAHKNNAVFAITKNSAGITVAFQIMEKNSDVRLLPGAFHNHAQESITDWFAHITANYRSLRDGSERYSMPPALTLIFRLVMLIAWHYVLRGGFRDGIPGVLLCLQHATQATLQAFYANGQRSPQV